MLAEQVNGICWPHTATVGHVTVTTPLIRGSFPAMQGSDGVACCDIAPAGKYRNGAARSWCRVHQQYWGIKSDLAAAAIAGSQHCARHAQPMHYVRDPLVIDPRAHASMVISLAGNALKVRLDGGAPSSHAALAIRYDAATHLFAAPDIIQINITPAVVAGCTATETPDCIACAKCRHPHLDLGSFASNAHQRHYCGYCGNDSTHSKGPIISNPLVLLLKHYRASLQLGSSIVHGDNML